jgi:hypothetical protein
MILQSQASWRAIERTKNGKRLARLPKTKIQNPKLISWLIEACIRSAGHPLSVATLEIYPTIFPFEIRELISYALVDSCTVELRSSGVRDQVVGVKGII